MQHLLLVIKVLLDPIPRNLRKIKRVINCFRFLAFIANRKNLLADKTIALYDLGAITILSLEYPEIYNLLFHENYHETIMNFLSAIENGLGSAQEKTKKDFEQRGIYIDQY